MLSTTTSNLPGSEEQKNDVLEIYPDGDTILVVGQDRRFLVSRDVLRAADTSFLSPELDPDSDTEDISLIDALQVRQNDDRPEIYLRNADPEAMEIILTALHFRRSETSQTLAPETLAKVALDSERYGWNRSLQPWIALWIGNIKGFLDTEAYGFLLTAARLFETEDSEHFRTVSIAAQRCVPLGFEAVWTEHDGILVGSHTLDLLRWRISCILSDILRQVEYVEADLWDASDAYDMDHLTCLPCEGRVYPLNTPQCAECQQENLQRQRCTMQTRVLSYRNILRSNNIFPMMDVMNQVSAVKLASRFTDLKADRHKCCGGLNCPLRIGLSRLQDEVRLVIEGVTSFSDEVYA